MWKYSSEEFGGSQVDLCRRLDELGKHHEIISAEMVTGFFDTGKHNRWWFILMRRFV